MIELQTSYAMPDRPRPILGIGAGGIVRNAHLPAYKIAGFEHVGLYDPDIGKAKTLADQFDVPSVFGSMEEALEGAPHDVVFDVAVPGGVVREIIPQLPDGAAVLIQKPLGLNLEDARHLCAVCRDKQLIAAVNFQLRYAPPIIALRSLVDRGLLGDLHDIQMQVTLWTPWELWDFLKTEKRVEILYHSIHYLDMIRSFAGDPHGVFARVNRAPGQPDLADVKSSIILDYGDLLRVTVSANHCHEGGLANQESYVRLEGSEGVAKVTLGLCMDYPRGRPDVFEYCLFGDGTPSWETLDIEGTWMPHAFIGTMASVMAKAEDPSRPLPTSVDDALRTMAVVEAAYLSSASGSTPIDYGD